mgnify:CR=1 FL=1
MCVADALEDIIDFLSSNWTNILKVVGLAVGTGALIDFGYQTINGINGSSQVFQNAVSTFVELLPIIATIMIVPTLLSILKGVTRSLSPQNQEGGNV